MQVFIPVTDEMLQGQSTIEGRFVPFRQDYLHIRDSGTRENMMPPGWISDNDYAAARRRLADCRT